MTSAPEGASQAFLPAGAGGLEESVTRVRGCVAELMKLGTQRKQLLQAAPAARRRGQAVEAAGPSEADIARLSRAVGDLEIKSEEQARDIQRAQAEIVKQDTRRTAALHAMEQLGTPAATAEQVAVVREGVVRREPTGQAQATSLPASPLQEAKQQLAEARSQRNDADSRFRKATETARQKQQNARDLAAKWTRVVEWADSHEGLLHCMGNKIKVDSGEALGALRLPPPQGDGNRESLLREFRTYQKELTKRRPDGRWQFRDTVEPGLPKLMAFDALMRTSMSTPMDSIGLTACHAYKAAHPGPHNPGLGEAGTMARLGLERVSAGWGFLTADEAVHASGRQKVDKLARQIGVSAAEAKQVRELRQKDIKGLSAHAGMLKELLEDNRADLEGTLGGFMAAGLLGLEAERKRFEGDANAARLQANQPDPEVAARMKEVIRARQAVTEAEAKVQRLEPPRRDPPRLDTTPEPRAAVVPQIQPAPPGPGLARDPETRIARRQGRILDLDAAQASARQDHRDASAALHQTDAALRQARERLETAAAEHGQAREAAQRELAQQRALRGEQASRLKELDAQIGQARDGLRTDPALLRLIDLRALERVIKIHVDPDDEALRQRALEQTGLNGRYDSLEHMAQAVTDVHEAANRRFPLLFAARTPQEFEQAAKAHTEYDAERKALINVPHEHGRLVGYGYDAKPDRTNRLIPLTRSEYGLAWREGRVVVSHLHPGVPRRTLRTLA